MAAFARYMYFKIGQPKAEMSEIDRHVMLEMNEWSNVDCSCVCVSVKIEFLFI